MPHQMPRAFHASTTRSFSTTTALRRLYTPCPRKPCVCDDSTGNGRLCYSRSKSHSNSTQDFLSHPPARQEELTSHNHKWYPYAWPKTPNAIPRPSPQELTSLLRESRAEHPNLYRTIATPPSGWKNFPDYDHHNLKHRRVLEQWLPAGPPPIEQYRLTFGKYKGKRLEEVPDSYLVKFLLPRGGREFCPVVGLAIEDFKRRFPEVRSQAGPGKTRAVREGVGEKRVGRGKKKTVESK